MPVKRSRTIENATVVVKKGKFNVPRNRMSKYVKRADTELKAADIDTSAYVFDTVGTLAITNAIAVGDDFDVRDGRQITMSSLQIHGLLLPVDQNTGENLARILVIYDKQPTGVLPAISDILDSSNSCALANLNNRQRFRFLADRIWSQGRISNVATQTFAAGESTYAVNMKVKLKGLKTTYSGTTAGISTISSGALYVITLGSQAPAAGGAGTLALRLRFYDN